MKAAILNIVFFLISGIIFCQGFGTIKGKVVDSNNLPIPQASVFIEFGANKIGSATDFEGNFTIKPISPGVYNLNVSSTGFNSQIVKGIHITADKITFMDKIILSDFVYSTKGEAEVIEYKTKIIDPGDPGRMSLTPAVIDNIPGKENLPNIIRTVSPEIKVSDDGNEIYFRGARNGTSAIYIDGVKSNDFNSKIVGMAIGSFTVYTGGIPAKYGDVTGGVVVIETKSYFDYLNERKYSK